ncbi:hypothetical protein EXIGLDRAFT_75396 [Exidia glandulosa HHB12029]|uniref:Uncharacterized protein n=1 Tax=Exidia glandulosa HHB12029 TaxID=1314781 RepID=A0A165HS17_EXIGL|nr:hypothetical protein EXIGLDRAFT_75396 [Exidia glandulosa HHB12029]
MPRYVSIRASACTSSLTMQSRKALKDGRYTSATLTHSYSTRVRVSCGATRCHLRLQSTNRRRTAARASRRTPSPPRARNPSPKSGVPTCRSGCSARYSLSRPTFDTRLSQSSMQASRTASCCIVSCRPPSRTQSGRSVSLARSRIVSATARKWCTSRRWATCWSRSWTTVRMAAFTRSSRHGAMSAPMRRSSTSRLPRAGRRGSESCWTRVWPDTATSVCGQSWWMPFLVV